MKGKDEGDGAATASSLLDHNTAARSSLPLPEEKCLAPNGFYQIYSTKKPPIEPWTNGCEGNRVGRKGTEKGGAGGERERGGKEQLIDLARVHFPSLNSKRNKLGQLEGKQRASNGDREERKRRSRAEGVKGEEEEEMFAPRHISCVTALCNETRVFVLAYTFPSP